MEVLFWFVARSTYFLYFLCKAWINSQLENITSAFQFRLLMILWLTLKHIALLDCVVGNKMFEKRGKTND